MSKIPKNNDAAPISFSIKVSWTEKLISFSLAHKIIFSEKMPIFARTKLIIHENCIDFAPGSPYPGLGYMKLDYKGPNPQNIYTKMRELFVTIWKIDPHELQERDFSWDRSKAEEKFRVTFDMVKDLDIFNFIQVIVTLDGMTAPSKDFGKEGSASIRIEARLRTEYPQDTLWQRSIFYEFFRKIYHDYIMKETRVKYKNQCRTDVIRFVEEVKTFLNLLPKSV